MRIRGEAARMAKYQVMQQAGTAILGQANGLSKGAITLNLFGPWGQFRNCASTVPIANSHGDAGLSANSR